MYDKYEKSYPFLQYWFYVFALYNSEDLPAKELSQLKREFKSNLQNILDSLDTWLSPVKLPNFLSKAKKLYRELHRETIRSKGTTYVSESIDEKIVDLALYTQQNLQKIISFTRIGVDDINIIKRMLVWAKNGSEAARRDIVRASRFIDNKFLRRVIWLSYAHATPKDYSNLVTKADKVSIKLFGKTTIPTPEEKQSVQKSKPVAYKKWLAAQNEKNKAFKDVYQSIFIENNWDYVTPKEVVKALKDHKITASNIDPLFPGLIDIDLWYYTKDRLKLIPNIGIKFKKNPAYNPDADDTYYGTSINTANKETVHYTEQCIARNAEDRFGKVAELADCIEDIRSKVANDMQSSKHDKRVIAFMIHLLDTIYARVGSSASEKDGKYGLHNLQVRHFIKRGNNYYFSYMGKSNIEQDHKLTDPNDVAFIKKLIKGKSKNDYIFTSKKGKVIRPIKLNAYLKSIKAPTTCHKFRHFHGSRIAYDLLINNFPWQKRKPNDRNIVDEYFKDCLLQVGQALGHKHGDKTTLNTSIKHYVDPHIMVEFYEKSGFNPPKNVENAIKRNTVESFYTPEVVVSGIFTKTDNNKDGISQTELPHRTIVEELFGNWVAWKLGKLLLGKKNAKQQPKNWKR